GCVCTRRPHHRAGLRPRHRLGGAGSDPHRRGGSPRLSRRAGRRKAMTDLLNIESVETCYGLSQVLFGVSLAIAPGEMVTLMGRNGMGKTTTVRSIMGLTPALAGAVRSSAQ